MSSSSTTSSSSPDEEIFVRSFENPEENDQVQSHHVDNDSDIDIDTVSEILEAAISNLKALLEENGVSAAAAEMSNFLEDTNKRVEEIKGLFMKAIWQAETNRQNEANISSIEPSNKPRHQLPPKVTTMDEFETASSSRKRRFTPRGTAANVSFKKRRNQDQDHCQAGVCDEDKNMLREE